MIICYATPEKLEYYPFFNPKNPLNYLQKRLLILGKEWVLSLRKRYPSLPVSQLKRAISQEIEDLFPLKNPSYTFQIFRKGETFIEVNLFAWEKSVEEELRNKFPFSHLIPEELFFSTKEPTFFILKRNSKFLLIASSDRFFLNSLFLHETPSKEEVSLFIKSLGELTIKRVIAIGTSKEEILEILPEDLKSYFISKNHPFNLLSEILPNLSLKDFRIKRKLEFNFSHLFLQASRLFLMIIIALQVNLLFSYFEYQRAINQLKEKNEALNQEIKKLISPIISKGGNFTSQDEERSKALEELKEEVRALERKGVAYPLFYLNELAKILPDGARIERFTLKEKSLEVYIEAKDIFEVLSRLRKNPFFSELKLTGTPLFDSYKNLYRFNIRVELK
jgi:hypothetical protein